MPTGTVKLFYPAKGFGFIRQDSGGKDVFFHLSTVQSAGLKHLRKGQKVSFEIFDNQGKLAARNLRIVRTPGASEDRLISSGIVQLELCEMSPKADDKAKGKREPIARAALEQALAEAVKTSRRECEAFVSVMVERIGSASPGAANWVVKGVKYGKANRSLCDAALSKRVNEGLSEFELSD